MENQSTSAEPEASDKQPTSGDRRPASGSPSAVLVVPLDTPESSLAELRAVGIVPVQTDNPESVRMITPGSNIVGGDLLMATMHGLCHTPYLGSDAAKAMRAEMVSDLFRRLKDREKSSKANETALPLAEKQSNDHV